MGENIRAFIQRLHDRRSKCSLCGQGLTTATATYGSYRFCSADHRAEWSACTVL